MNMAKPATEKLANSSRLVAISQTSRFMTALAALGIVLIVIGSVVQYVWVSWSDGGARSHIITVPSVPTTCTANFKLNYVVRLYAGWNLVSLQVVPVNTAITSVHSGLIASNEVASVWSYSAATKTWQFFTPPAAGTLKTMTDGNGYWVFMRKADILYVNGSIIPSAASPPIYSLNSGWNLVGFKPQPIVQNETVAQYLTSISSRYDVSNVWIYDNNNGVWIRATPSTWIVPGQAMWILVTSPSGAALRP